MKRLILFRREGHVAVVGALFAAAVLSGCVSYGPPAGPPVALQATPGQAALVDRGIYRLQAGDTVSVFVFDNPELSQTAVVAPDGRLSYPLAGTFAAQGRTVDEVRRILDARFADSIVSPQVSVSLVSVGQRRVFVTGEVVRPGAIEIDEPITLVQAIALSGGFTAFAQREHILVYNPQHPNGARRVFDYTKFITNAAGQDIALHPGDTIVVE